MGSSTKIYLNPHAKTKQVFEVLLKVVGNECLQIAGPSLHLDKHSPASYKNSWMIKFPKNENNEITMDSPQSIYFNFNFQDILGKKHTVMYFYEGYVNELSSEIDKQLNPDSTPLWAAIGKRLVDIFGGKMLYDDSKDCEDMNNWYQCETPKFPVKATHESDINRSYQYQNLIFDEPMITTKEIKEMMPHTRYYPEHVRELVAYLEKYEHALQLSNELKDNSNKTKTIKLKV